MEKYPADNRAENTLYRKDKAKSGCSLTVFFRHCVCTQRKLRDNIKVTEIPLSIKLYANENIPQVGLSFIFDNR